MKINKHTIISILGCFGLLCLCALRYEEDDNCDGNEAQQSGHCSSTLLPRVSADVATEDGPYHHPHTIGHTQPSQSTSSLCTHTHCTHTYNTCTPTHMYMHEHIAHTHIRTHTKVEGAGQGRHSRLPNLSDRSRPS